MRRHVALAVALWAPLVAPSIGAGQVGIGARVGTLGIGLEGAADLGERLAVRGGVGLSVGLQTFEPTTEFDGVPVQLRLPGAWYTLGLEYYLSSVFRVGGGLLLAPGQTDVEGAFTDPVDIGGRTLTLNEIGRLRGTIETHERAAYALVGFGRHTDSGLGLSLDVGAAFLGAGPSVSLDAVGGTLPRAEIEPLLAIEERHFEADMKTYLRVWPILSLGLRYGG